MTRSRLLDAIARDLFPVRGHRHEYVRFDRRQELEHVGGRGEVGLPAERVAEAELAEAEDVAHRQPEQIEIVLGEEWRVRLEPVGTVAADVAMREWHAFRIARRAARVEHLGRLIEIDGGEARVDERGVGDVTRGGIGSPRHVGEIDDLGRVRERATRLLEARDELGAGDEHVLDLGVTEDVRDLLGRRRRIDRYEQRPGGLCAERGARPCDGVVRIDRDAFARREVVLDQPARDAADLRRELAPRHGVPRAGGVADLKARAIAMRCEACEHRVRRRQDFENRRDIHT